MSDTLDLNLSELPAPLVEEDEIAIVDDSLTAVVNTTLLKCRVPSQYAIEPFEDGIEARCHTTGDHFIGSISEFNELLRA
jgi:PleD family two-component response regulator